MSKITDAIELAKRWAADPAHGYDQNNRWGPDYDCSSFLISVWESVGVPVKSNGATYTGNMYSVFTRCGFVDVTASCETIMGAGLEPGDILLNDAYHTEMYIGDGQLVGASINELGGVTGGQTGDQTGGEIRVRGWYSYSHGWTHVLRYGITEAPEALPFDGSSYMVRQGDSWWRIAYEHGMSMYELARINGKSIESIIYPGDVLRLIEDADDEVEPETDVEDGWYTVKSGDSLWSICERELGNPYLYREVAEMNGLLDPGKIYPGQRIRLWEDGCRECMLPEEV